MGRLTRLLPNHKTAGALCRHLLSCCALSLAVIGHCQSRLNSKGPLEFAPKGVPKGCESFPYSMRTLVIESEKKKYKK